jgi:hypothetical protein
MMSLNEPDTQAQGSIEDGLAGSDPRLASMLDIFSRLAAGEEMPYARRSWCGAGGRQPTVRAAPGGTRAGAEPSRKRAGCTRVWAGRRPCCCCGLLSPPDCSPSHWSSTPAVKGLHPADGNGVLLCPVPRRADASDPMNLRLFAETFPARTAVTLRNGSPGPMSAHYRPR